MKIKPYSLVELVTVLVIIAIMLSLLVPGLLRALNMARNI